MSDEMPQHPIRLTSFSHGGGCGCKVAPALLESILRGMERGAVPPSLLVGRDTADDAAVYLVNEHQAVVSTTDFFMPIVDDPYDFGRIAATNAISDIYAMGARPLMALAIVCMPTAQIPVDVIRRILQGGQDACSAAGIPVSGGHTIDSVEPIYGLAVTGLVDPRHLKRNSTARPGDDLVLGKPLGVGVLSAALKRQVLSGAGYAAMVEATTQLNAVGPTLAELDGVHAMTDVTGFGLLGHALELCRGSGVSGRVSVSAVPWLPGVWELAKEGVLTGASGRNWASYGHEVELAPGLEKPLLVRALLTDPQTSGGLLVACAPGVTARVLEAFHQGGFSHAAVVGRCSAGEPRIEVTA